jgi:hypothetical protein
MQITLNKVPFEVRPVEGPLRTALLAEPGLRRAAGRAVWAWDKEARTGRFLVPTTPDKSLAAPLGLAAFVAKAGATNGAGVQKAEGPHGQDVRAVPRRRGRQKWDSVMQAVARVTGVPQKKIPFEEFASLNEATSYEIRMLTEFQVLELSNPSRNCRPTRSCRGSSASPWRCPRRSRGWRYRASRSTRSSRDAGGARHAAARGSAADDEVQVTLAGASPPTSIPRTRGGSRW